MTRSRTGKRIELTARDLTLFELLTRYRYLRSTYLHAFAGGASVTRFKERLGDLFHEGYLDRPAQQWEYADARSRPAVHALGKGAVRVLRDAGRGVEEARIDVEASAHRQFRHSLMICEALASLELGVRQVDGLRFIPWREILVRAPEATRASTAPFRLPVPSGGYLVPDAAFGIEYRTGETKSYRFFALEADRGTMPIVRSARSQTSYMAKLAAYGEAIRSSAHKTQWGIPNLLVLTLTTSEARMRTILQRFKGETSATYLFKAVHDGELSAPSPRLLSEPWQRSGLPLLAIDA